jgi:hypothetical protein
MAALSKDEWIKDSCFKFKLEDFASYVWDAAIKNTMESKVTASNKRVTQCPWFVHGENCANIHTTLRCYEKPCTFDRAQS